MTWLGGIWVPTPRKRRKEKEGEMYKFGREVRWTEDRKIFFSAKSKFRKVLFWIFTRIRRLQCSVSLPKMEWNAVSLYPTSSCFCLFCLCIYAAAHFSKSQIELCSKMETPCYFSQKRKLETVFVPCNNTIWTPSMHFDLKYCSHYQKVKWHRILVLVARAVSIFFKKRTCYLFPWFLS